MREEECGKRNAGRGMREDECGKRNEGRGGKTRDRVKIDKMAELRRA